MKSDVAPRPTNPEPQDLLHLQALHGILGALNDPSAGVHQLKAFCNRLPSLRNRIVAAAETTSRAGREIDLGYALAVLGNRGLGEVLLQYLEDLTILKSDLEDRRIASTIGSPYVDLGRGHRPSSDVRGLR